MFSFLTDDKNDLYLDVVDPVGDATANSKLVSAEGIEALRQIIVNRVRLQRGEYAYNLERGIDYLGLLLTDTPLIRIWENQVFDLLDEIEDIKAIEYWNYRLNGNNFEFRLSVDSDYGIVEIKG